MNREGGTILPPGFLVVTLKNRKPDPGCGVVLGPEGGVAAKGPCRTHPGSLGALPVRCWLPEATLPRAVLAPRATLPRAVLASRGQPGGRRGSRKAKTSVSPCDLLVHAVVQTFPLGEVVLEMVRVGTV